MMRQHLRASLTVIVLLYFSPAIAQDYIESALLFGRNRPTGSARVLGLGGSQTALGGDYSSVLSNPAGLGMFNRSEFTFSLGLADHQTSANYLGTHTDDNRSVFNIPGISYVWNIPKANSESFYGGSLGISMSRVNDFNRSTLYQGNNTDNSIIDFFIDQANGETTDQFFEDTYPNYNTPTALAYFNYLIGPTSILNPPGPEDQYFTDATYPYQQEEIIAKGASNQWSVSYGGNIQDKFFFGGGIGVTTLRYKSQKIFTEDFLSDTLENLQLIEDLDIRGTGINATLGAIVRPVEFLQVGLSYTTPTFYGLTEIYEASMSSRWNNFDYYGDGTTILSDNSDNPEEIDLVTSEYNFTAPMKLTGGVAFISEYGFISADVEMVNPAKAKYGSKDSRISFSNENESIKAVYQPVINYRIGAEFRKDIFRVRAGYGVQANTFSDTIEADNSITSVSGGLGVRTKIFYIDLAIVHSSTKDFQYSPYTFSDGSGPVVDLKNKTINGVITVGFTF
ncbi:MAG TPA: hypothetical protein VFO54_03215 [Chryseosolibacter sp.]|nr:hypothetical protein [Chryseosolibacter sp.]